MVESFRPILLISDLGLSQQYIPMQTQAPKRVLAVMTDLFFSVKLVEAAKGCGLSLEFVKEPKELFEKGVTVPSLIVFDLNYEAAEQIKLIAKLKGKTENKGIRVLGFLLQVQGELK